MTSSTVDETLDGDRGTRAARAVTAVILIGAALRLIAYLAARSLWLDEAMLANNIVGRTFVALLGPLGENQSAPWLFLLGERAAIVVAGPNELALRLLPLAAGIAIPYVAWLPARRMFDDMTGVVAAAIAAVSPLLLYYSNEVKPYGIDALVCVSLVLLTIRVLDAPSQSTRWAVLLLAGVCGVWSAFPSAFALAGCWCALVASADACASRHARLMLSLAVVVWGAAFAAPYVHVIRYAANDPFLTTFFADRFLIPGNGALVSLWRLWQDVSTDVFMGRDAVARFPQSVQLTLSIAILVLWTMLLERTAFGRHVYAVGGNAEAARRAGISVSRVRTIGFVLCSMTAGMAGIIYLSQLGGMTTNINGGQLVLYAVAAAVIGGTSLFGGRGRAIHGVLGGLVIGAIYNGLYLLGMPIQYQLIATGLVLLAAVSVNSLSRRGAGAPASAQA